MTHSLPDGRQAPGDRHRLTLLALTLLAFAHVTVLLDMKALWWDESLSLQRAEQALPELLRGVLWLRDGFTDFLTIDQHPFMYFLLQGGLIRLAGDDEFVLRFVSAMAATLLTPAIWVLGRWLARRSVAPASTPWWAALLAAFSPFILWYGQEARPYALWVMLAVLTTYLLLRATEAETLNRRFAAGFVLAELMLLTTHYYAVFLLPLHALIIFVWVVRRSLAAALITAAVVLLAGSVVAIYGASIIIGQGGGANFAPIALAVLAPDLLNAFSLGLSVDITQVWWIDLVFGALALAGAVWNLRSRVSIRQGGWILPVFVLMPIAILLVLDAFRPLYMNARHLGLLLGGFLLLVGAGLGAVWARQRWLAGLLAVGLVAATAYSTVNYFMREEYAKDDYRRLGEYMQGRIMPGDAILYYPPSSWRIFEYYLPMAAFHKAAAEGANVGVYGVPLLDQGFDATTAWLEELAGKYDRIWVIKSGTHPYFDRKGQVEAWLRKHFLQVRDAKFFSHSSLRSQLYLPEIPVFEALPAEVQHPVQVEFGEQIRLAGYRLAAPADCGLPGQARLYWQVLVRPERRYKFILELLARHGDGTVALRAAIEREPYEGDIPTLYWDPGKTILEFVEFPSQVGAPPAGGELVWAMTMYDAETLEKLPVTRADGLEILPGGVTVVLPAGAAEWAAACSMEAYRP